MYKKMAFRPKRGSGRSGNRGGNMGGNRGGNMGGNRGGNRGGGIGSGNRDKVVIGEESRFTLIFFISLLLLFQGYVPNHLLHLYWKLGLYINYGDTR